MMGAVVAPRTETRYSGEVAGPGDERRASEWEQRCVARAQRGDRAAFAELYDAYAGPLYDRVLLPRLGSAATAEDVLAETFRAALESLADFEPRGPSIWFWLARIAANRANDAHRAAERQGRLLAGFERMVGPLLDGGPPPGTEGDQIALRLQARDRVQAVLPRLKERYRRALELRFLEDRERLDCAALLEVTPRTFDVLLLRALRAFRREWEREVGLADEESQ